MLDCITMKALLLFHLKVGCRLAVRSFVPLFSALLALIMLDMYPAALVASIARALFRSPPDNVYLLLTAALAFALASWAAPRATHGLNGWLRHLPIGSRPNRRGVLLALLVVQLPLMLSLALLASVAHSQGIAVTALCLVRFTLVCAAAAMAAMPVTRSSISMPSSAVAALLTLSGGRWTLMISAALLVVTETFSGSLRNPRRGRTLKSAGVSIELRLCWRALGWRILASYGVAALPLGAAALFIANNELTGTLAAGAARFGSSLALVLFLSGWIDKLAVRRPVWPWARSLPWSSTRRVLSDALIMAAHAVPVALGCAFVSGIAALPVLLLLPALVLRAATHMRRLPERQTGTGGFLLEGCFASSLTALLPWTVFLGLAASPAAFLAAKQADAGIKATRWLERRHLAVGDPLSWSE